MSDSVGIEVEMTPTILGAYSPIWECNHATSSIQWCRGLVALPWGEAELLAQVVTIKDLTRDQ